MPKDSFKKIILTLSVAVSVIFLNNHFFNKFFQNLFYALIPKVGIFLADKSESVSDYGRGLFKIKEVVKENNALKEDNKVLLGEIAEIDGLRRENNLLRDELKVARRLNSRLLIVEIFHIQKDALSSTALINKGQSSGIKKSMPVVMSGNVLVGIVDEVFENSARIILLDDPRTKIGVRIKDTGILAETRGELGNRLSLDLITQQDSINKGDMVLTSGLDNLSESLPVGLVDGLETGGSGLFQKVIVKPLFDLSLGSSLFVILD